MSDREHSTEDLLIVLDALRSEQQAGDGHFKSFLDTDSVAWLVEQVIELRGLSESISHELDLWEADDNPENMRRLIDRLRWLLVGAGD